jgi:hypothetical protein
MIYDHAARVRSFEIGAEAFKEINAARGQRSPEVVRT